MALQEAWFIAHCAKSNSLKNFVKQDITVSHAKIMYHKINETALLNQLQRFAT